MPYATANGLPVLKATIYEQIEGRWVADVEVDTTDDIDGAVELLLSDGAVTFNGTVHRGGNYFGRWHGRIVGGAGGISTELPAIAYYSCPLGLPLADIMALSGETLGADSVALTGWTVSHWLRSSGPASDALSELASDIGHRWRIQRNGTVLLVVDTYPELVMEYDLINQNPEIGTVVVSPKGAPLLRPGVSFDGLDIDSVITTVTTSSVRQEYSWT